MYIKKVRIRPETQPLRFIFLVTLSSCSLVEIFPQNTSLILRRMRIL